MTTNDSANRVSHRLSQRQFYLRLLPGTHTHDGLTLSAIGDWTLLPVLEQYVQANCASHGKRISLGYRCIRRSARSIYQDLGANERFENRLARIVDAFDASFQGQSVDMYLRVALPQYYKEEIFKTMGNENGFAWSDQQVRFLRIASKAEEHVGRARLNDLADLSHDIVAYLRCADQIDVLLSRPCTNGGMHDSPEVRPAYTELSPRRGYLAIQVNEPVPAFA